MIIKKRIPVCLPDTIGWKYLEDKDYSRIVYYAPDNSESIPKPL